MENELPWYEHLSIPALLRQARRTYGEAMRAALEDAGYDDIPANGSILSAGSRWTMTESRCGSW